MDSRFWRLIAATVVVGLFYVGHGLHQGDSASMTSMAQAQTMHYFNKNDGDPTAPILFTQSQDGSKIHAWRIRPNQVRSNPNNAVRHLGSWDAK